MRLGEGAEFRMSVPLDDGFTMPAEWHPHERCWMAWPCHPETWGDGLEAARDAYAAVAKAIAAFEPVTMLANSGDVAAASLRCGSGVEVMAMALTDSWTRDTGPTFVVDGKGGIAGVDWRFNAWGGNYDDFADDAALAERLLQHLGIARYAAPVVMEGGAIHVDGEGTGLAVESVLLNPNRNPDVDKATMDRHLRELLGIETMIWLPAGLADDETDGHVDNLACFARPGVVAVLDSDDDADSNYTAMKAAIDLLETASDAQGRTLEVVRIPQPPRRDKPDGTRVALSYINFYVANGGVVMPAFEEATDSTALRAVEKLFPDRQVVQVVASDIVVGGGGIHCITQQQPRPLAE
jgi:agmatine deiminase